MNAELIQNSRLFATLLTCLDNAESTIDAAIYQLSPDTRKNHARMRDLWQALRNAPLRGVSCNVIIDAGHKNLNGMHAAIAAAEQLRDAGWSVLLSSSNRLMHAKVVTFDRHTTIIGSHNWTINALAGNYEAGIMIHDEQIAHDTQQTIADWWAAIALSQRKAK